MKDKIDTLNHKIAEAHLGGGKNRIAKQHSNKKLTARERVNCRGTRRKYCSRRQILSPRGISA